MPTRTENLYGPPKVGGDILAYCTRCKMDLAHVVVSMLDRHPAKVICKSCKSQHTYRRGASPAVARRLALGQSVERKPRQVTTIRACELWEQKLAKSNRDQVRTYRVSENYTLGDVIQHSKFGVGLVEEVKRNGKILVLFRDGEKVLVHGMENTSAQ